MSELRNGLRKASTEKLKVLISQAELALHQVAVDSGVGYIELAKMVAGGRTQTLRQQVVTRMVGNAEASLLARWEDDQPVVVQVDIEDAA